jgi:hypothetical protein
MLAGGEWDSSEGRVPRKSFRVSFAITKLLLNSKYCQTNFLITAKGLLKLNGNSPGHDFTLCTLHNIQVFKLFSSKYKHVF